MAFSVFGLCALLLALRSSSDSPTFVPTNGLELSLLEEWWKDGQGKGYPWESAADPVDEHPFAVGRLISDRAHRSYWTEEQLRELTRFILRKSAEYKVSPFLILSLIDVESGFRPAAVSRRGAVGLMQLKPATAEEVALAAGMIYYPELLTDPQANIELALRYVRKLKEQFHNEQDVLTAYNIGPSALREKLAQGDDISLEYFHRVKSRMRDFGRRTRAPRALWTHAWL